jgi:hypothetical protein
LKEISSFDISSICYNIPTWKYSDKTYYELVIVLYSELKKIIEDENYGNSIRSIDNTEFIFKEKSEKVRLLRLIFNELLPIYQDLLPQTSFTKFL